MDSLRYSVVLSNGWVCPLLWCALPAGIRGTQWHTDRADGRRDAQSDIAPVFASAPSASAWRSFAHFLMENRKIGKRDVKKNRPFFSNGTKKTVPPFRERVKNDE